jgi:uncharacterized protein (DUF927 family)
MAEIDADAGSGMGALEVLHGLESPAALAMALKDAAALYHGAVGAEFLRRIVSDRPRLAAVLADGIAQFVKEFVPKGADGQVERVARRFGLVAIAGEMATRYGLTGWVQGEAIGATSRCFASWLESFGATGKREEREVLAHVRSFFEQHGASRFEDMESNESQRIINRAGFYRCDADGIREYLVLPEAFKREVCGGFDCRFVKKALQDTGWLIPGNDRTTHKVRVRGLGPTWVYVLTPNMWEAE